jgi:hypothetical protein
MTTANGLAAEVELAVTTAPMAALVETQPEAAAEALRTVTVDPVRGVGLRAVLRRASIPDPFHRNI